MNKKTNEKGKRKERKEKYEENIKAEKGKERATNLKTRRVFLDGRLLLGNRFFLHEVCSSEVGHLLVGMRGFLGHAEVRLKWRTDRRNVF